MKREITQPARLSLFAAIALHCGSPSPAVMAPPAASDAAADTAMPADTDAEGEGEGEQSAAETSSDIINTPDDTPGAPAQPVSDTADSAPPEEIRFAWSPSRQAAAAYEMTDPLDQHRVVLTRGVKPGGRYPVVLAFHGQPARDRNPRDYRFLQTVPQIIHAMVDAGELPPLILVMPVFRFTFGNWPMMSPRALQKQVSSLLSERDIATAEWVAFGHSGAAGCGGDGLNAIHLISPAAVGFFDTCLGPGWQNANKELLARKIPTVNIYSVETAGFRPRQRPEYQSTFDFCRAFQPVGILPVSCPDALPGPLRDQPCRCAADETGVLSAFVVDTGEGESAHQQVLQPAIRYFLLHFAGLASSARANP